MITRWSPESPRRTSTASVISTRNRCGRPGAARPGRSSSPLTSTALPATFESKKVPGAGLSPGSSVPLCKANRGSLRRSKALSEPGIIPSHSSPFSNAASMPLTRGEPSFLRVASTLCVYLLNLSSTCAANSGAVRLTELQLTAVVSFLVSRRLPPHAVTSITVMSPPPPSISALSLVV